MKKICLLLSIFIQFHIFYAQNPDSKELDELLNSLENVEKTENVDNYKFLKRIYLNTVGRIPRVDEIKSFINDSTGNKREKLIDTLIASKGYDSHMYNFFSNILRVKVRVDNNRHGGSYIDFIKESIAQNKPYDIFVQELINSEGHVWKKGNGAAGYYVRDRGMLQDNLSNTMRIFNGTRLECAQCHDHPFEEWKQKDFYKLLAFNGGMKYDIKPNFKVNLKKEFNDEEFSSKNRKQLRILSAIFQDATNGTGTGAVKLPKDYQYDDAKPNQIVTAKSILGENIELKNVQLLNNNKQKKKKKRSSNRVIAKEIGSREYFSKWLTSKDNPHFSSVIANRMWKKAYGYAITDNLDDITSSTKTRNKKLMTFLEQKMKDFDYDLKKFQSMIYNSKHFQSKASTHENDGKLVHTPLIQRMSAEQIWDSILTLVVTDIDTPMQNSWDKYYETFARLEKQKNAKDLASEIKKIIAESEVRKKHANQFKTLKKEYTKSISRLSKKKKFDEAKKVRKEMNAAIAKYESEKNTMNSNMDNVKKKNPKVARASEIMGYPKSTHILNVFGKSDGDQIEGAHKESIPTQALFLLNGSLSQAGVYSNSSPLMSNLNAETSIEDKINMTFLTILCRNAEPDEILIFKDDQTKRKSDVYHDSITTLISSAEFMFIQ